MFIVPMGFSPLNQLFAPIQSGCRKGHIAPHLLEELQGHLPLLRTDYLTVPWGIPQ